MTLIDIENLSFAELKERRAELIEAATGSPDLAARYVQARTDAKLRDDKLAEQGQTITSLNAALAAAQEKCGELERTLKAAQAALLAEGVRAADREAKLTHDYDRLDAALRTEQSLYLAEQDRANRLKAEALRNRKALNGAAKLLNDALAETQIEDAG